MEDVWFQCMATCFCNICRQHKGRQRSARCTRTLLGHSESVTQAPLCSSNPLGQWQPLLQAARQNLGSGYSHVRGQGLGHSLKIMPLGQVGVVGVVGGGLATVAPVNHPVFILCYCSLISYRKCNSIFIIIHSDYRGDQYSKLQTDWAPLLPKK